MCNCRASTTNHQPPTTNQMENKMKFEYRKMADRFTKIMEKAGADVRSSRGRNRNNIRYCKSNLGRTFRRSRRMLLPRKHLGRSRWLFTWNRLFVRPVANARSTFLAHWPHSKALPPANGTPALMIGQDMSKISANMLKCPIDRKTPGTSDLEI